MSSSLTSASSSSFLSSSSSSSSSHSSSVIQSLMPTPQWSDILAVCFPKPIPERSMTPSFSHLSPQVATIAAFFVEPEGIGDLLKPGKNPGIFGPRYWLPLHALFRYWIPNSWTTIATTGSASSSFPLTTAIWLLYSTPFLLPCGKCRWSCSVFISTNPPEQLVRSALDAHRYYCELHNYVNMKFNRDPQHAALKKKRIVSCHDTLLLHKPPMSIAEFTDAFFTMMYFVTQHYPDEHAHPFVVRHRRRQRMVFALFSDLLPRGTVLASAFTLVFGFAERPPPTTTIPDFQSLEMWFQQETPPASASSSSSSSPSPSSPSPSSSPSSSLPSSGSSIDTIWRNADTLTRALRSVQEEVFLQTTATASAATTSGERSLSEVREEEQERALRPLSYYLHMVESSISIPSAFSLVSGHSTISL